MDDKNISIIQLITTHSEIFSISVFNMFFQLLTIFGYVSFYVPFIFAPIGIVLNILIIIIYSNFSLETKNTTRLYYISIAISELGTLIFEDVWFGLIGTGWDFVFHGHNPLGYFDSSSLSSPYWICPLNAFLWSFFEMIANNTFVILELERLGALYFPLKTRSVFTMKKALIAVMILTILSFLISIITIPLVRIQVVGFLTVCTTVIPTMPWSDFGMVRTVFLYISPPILILLCSILILIKIIQRRISLHHGTLSQFNRSVSSVLTNRDVSVSFVILPVVQISLFEYFLFSIHLLVHFYIYIYFI